MTKRPHGAGSIFKTSNGKWRAQVSVSGKRLSFTADTQKKANSWIRTTINQVESGLTFSSAQITVSDFLENWLRIKEGKVRISTFEQYTRFIKKYIKPGLGHLKLKDLSAATLQALITDLQDQGRGKRTIAVVKTILHGSLKHAHRLGLVTQNWAKLIEVPTPEKRQMKVWDESQVSQFLAYAPDQTFYRLAFATGMRRGELIGLKWEDLDWQAGTISVRRQVFIPAGGGWIFQEPKTKKGERTIQLGPGLISALRDHYNRVLPLARELASDSWVEHDLIFPNSVGNPRCGYHVTKNFKRLVIKAGLPDIRFHDIRHTVASLLLMHGEPPVRVASILGHTVDILLKTYAHCIPNDDQARAAQIMDNITTPTTIDLTVKDCTHIARESNVN